MEELVIEEVPDINYDHIGGLEKELEQVKDAVELPFLHPELFAEHQLSLHQKVFCSTVRLDVGKRSIAKAGCQFYRKKTGSSQRQRRTQLLPPYQRPRSC